MNATHFKTLLVGLIMVCAPVQLQSSPVQAGVVGASEYSVGRCSGCGCRGGPGWRSKRTGQCVGWENLARECGNPPSPKRCTKEN